ncbi:5-(carboxyamino)imidazole ribonucleotide synthase [Carnobacterium alterfunditum]|uniref:5-(carboxyamino)imidazole ribonucleotide synthase n=1 Tax=Carnobacterium alterfunditum TaxID=28230 RepID=UPI0015BC5362|nr:5-(carboxyamino)imidazole ribonucleotide synthase [Carnobacterium alterfunditum]
MISLSNLISPGKLIGIIGGGEIARMMALSAKKMGYHIGVMDPEKDCPAAQIADWQIIAQYDDQEALMDFAMKCDVVTYEYDNIDADAIIRMKKTVPVPQGADLLSIIQDRLLEKAYLEASNINLAPYVTIVTVEDIKWAINEIGFPCVLKTISERHNGKDRCVLQSEEDIFKAAFLLKRGTCVLEAWIPFERELSVTVARNQANQIVVFPVAENIHRNAISLESIVPARIDHYVEEEIERIARTVAENLEVIGILGIGMFITSSGTLYVNEIIPRPHHTGNYSIEACSLSQYDAHIRAICGWPLPEIELLSPAVMATMLAEQDEAIKVQIQLKPNWNFHYYGKEKATKGQRIGHITVLTKDIEKTLATIADTGIWK